MAIIKKRRNFKRDLNKTYSHNPKNPKPLEVSMKQVLLFFIGILCYATLLSAQTTPVFINEIHYDNTGSDQDEGVEIAGPAGTNLSGWRVVLYNGNNGSSYGTINLSGTIPDLDAGYGALWFPETGIQNGSPDGLALVDDISTVIQFLSYEGSFTAIGGPANSITSQDIGVSEPGEVGQSLQLSGTGTTYEDFTWQAPSAHTRDSINTSQTFQSGSLQTSVQFASGSGSVSEGAGTYMLVLKILNPDAAQATSCQVALISGDSQDIDNFATQNVTFPAGSSDSITIELTITDDTFYEGNETLTFSIENVSGGNSAGAGLPDTFTLTITDNDAPDVPAIVITEIMLNPDQVSDSNGEWFELFNASGSEVDINGWKISDNGSNSHIINNSVPLIIPPGGYMVLARNSDTTMNGNVTVDYEYGSSFTLGNSDDEIILIMSDSIEVDRVEYDGNWPNPTGASMVLTNLTLDNNVGANWGTSTEAYGDGDFGTPGTLGSDSQLPVELTAFSGRATASGVQLNWTTASETDNAGFILLRNGVEVASFNNTNALKGQGTTSGHTKYNYLDQSATLGSYAYTLRSEDYSGLLHDYTMSVTIEVTELDGGVSVEPSYALDQNYPNPFNPTTNISFTMKEAGSASIVVYDLLGRSVKTLTVNAQKGANVVNFDGSSLTSGMYFYQMTANGFSSAMKRMILVK